jgi:hypothetical protein
MDEVPQFLQQFLTDLDILTGKDRYYFMIDLPVLVLFQQTDGFAFNDSSGFQAVTCNEVAIHVVPFRGTRPQDKAIRIGIRSGDPTRLLILQGFFIIQILLTGTRVNFDAYLYHADLSPTHHAMD